MSLSPQNPKQLRQARAIAASFPEAKGLLPARKRAKWFALIAPMFAYCVITVVYVVGMHWRQIPEMVVYGVIGTLGAILLLGAIVGIMRGTGFSRILTRSRVISLQWIDPSPAMFFVGQLLYLVVVGAVVALGFKLFFIFADKVKSFESPIINLCIGFALAWLVFAVVSLIYLQLSSGKGRTIGESILGLHTINTKRGWDPYTQETAGDFANFPQMEAKEQKTSKRSKRGQDAQIANQPAPPPAPGAPPAPPAPPAPGNSYDHDGGYQHSAGVSYVGGSNSTGTYLPGAKITRMPVPMSTSQGASTTREGFASTSRTAAPRPAPKITSAPVTNKGAQRETPAPAQPRIACVPANAPSQTPHFNDVERIGDMPSTVAAGVNEARDYANQQYNQAVEQVALPNDLSYQAQQVQVNQVQPIAEFVPPPPPAQDPAPMQVDPYPEDLSEQGDYDEAAHESMDLPDYVDPSAPFAPEVAPAYDMPAQQPAQYTMAPPPPPPPPGGAFPPPPPPPPPAMAGPVEDDFDEFEDATITRADLVNDDDDDLYDTLEKIVVQDEDETMVRADLLAVDALDSADNTDNADSEENAGTADDSGSEENPDEAHNADDADNAGEEDSYHDDETIIKGANSIAGWTIVIDTGQTIDLVDQVLLGRNPAELSEFPEALRISVEDPEMSISKTHAHIQLLDGNIIVRDLGSTNGTTVTVENEDTVELSEPFTIYDPAAALVTIGDRVLSFAPMM